jgi:hypothetical protein
MKGVIFENIPIEGKTYTLFGNSNTTTNYYRVIKSLADRILESNPDIGLVLETLAKNSSRKRYLRKIITKPVNGECISDWLNLIDPELKQFTLKTDEHLKSLPLFKIWDRRLATSREQYHLYMLEIELTNRYYVTKFNHCDRKIALLPYCLQDFTVQCKASPKGFDYQCKGCSTGCFQNQTSTILKSKNIEPFIWMEGNMKGLAKETLKKGQRLGVFGIACIPELVWGMRQCRKYKIPVIGMPLNANRCSRWFGEFFPNSVNLKELESLVSY